MAEPIQINLTGVNPSTVHLHITMSSDNQEILSRLTSMENTMSALSDAVDALIERINTDVTELQRLLAEKDALLQAALATDAADAATIADLTAQNDAKNAEIADTIARIQAIDPVTDFPPAG